METNFPQSQSYLGTRVKISTPRILALHYTILPPDRLFVFW